MSRRKRLLRIVGNSRSGTTWLSRVLRAEGLDVRHEICGKDGTVSCFFFVDWDWYPLSPSTPPKGLIAHQTERLSDYRFEHTWHVVRHPLRTIGSIWSTMGTQHQLWLEDIGLLPGDLKPKLLKSMYAWHRVNLHCERIADWTFRLEDAVRGQEVWRHMMHTLGRETTRRPRIPVTNRSRGIFAAKKVTWSTMRRLDPDLASQIQGMAEHYGYRR